MILSAISAMARNRVIGFKNKLPWNIPEDLKFFKEKTKGRILIMGRKTFESLPGILPGRFHIIISREKVYKSDNTCSVCSVKESIELAKAMLQSSHPKYRSSFGDEVFVVGGAEIYTEFMPFLDRIYLTEIDLDVEGDAYFPNFDQSKFKLVEKVECCGSPSFSFCTFSVESCA